MEKEGYGILGSKIRSERKMRKDREENNNECKERDNNGTKDRLGIESYHDAPASISPSRSDR